MAIIARNYQNYPTFSNLLEDFFTKSGFDYSDKRTSFVPSVNINENDEGFGIEVAAPGLEKKDFKLNLDNKVLTISTNIEEEKSENTENYLRKEFSYNSFERSFNLPELVDTEKITAQYKSGVLYVSIPKREEAKVKPAREIEIN